MDIPQAKALFLRHYGRLGAIRDAGVITEGVVSSSIFVIQTEDRKYCLKIPRYRKQQSLAGTDREYENWVLIADVRDWMRSAGVPVEECVKTDAGLNMGKDGEDYFWVSKHYESVPFDGSLVRLKQAGKVLATYHEAGTRLLLEHSGLAEKMALRLKRDMPLEYSLEHIADTERLLFDDSLCSERRRCVERAGTLAKVRELYRNEVKPQLQEFLAALASVDRAVTIVHNDFHPANILYGSSGAIILDLEQMTVGPRMKCLAFSLCRFAYEALRTKSVSDVGVASRAYADGYISGCGGNAVNLSVVPVWIRAYELEKILRIMRKFLADGAYPNNFEKLVTHHIPLFRDAGLFAVNK